MTGYTLESSSPLPFGSLSTWGAGHVSSPAGRLSHCWPNQPSEKGGRQKQRKSKSLIHRDFLIPLLTIYDMCKAIDRGMVMSDIRVMEKHGGKSGSWKVE